MLTRPDSGLLWLNLARALIHRNRLSPAEQALDSALEQELITVHRWYALYLRGLLAIQRDMPLADISERLGRAYDCMPGKLEPLYHLSRVLKQAGQVQQAYELSSLAVADFEYDRGFYYEPEVHAYEALIQHAALCATLGHREEAATSINRLRQSPGLPLSERKVLEDLERLPEDAIHESGEISADGKGGEIQLTIGMATYDDFDGVFFTLQSIYSYLREEFDQACEFLVIDNNPRGECGKALRVFAESMPHMRYLPYDHIQGSAAAKNQVFVHARGEIVLCLDSHVLLMPGSISSLLNYYRQNPGSGNLLQGASLSNSHSRYDYRMRMEWREDGFLGRWRSEDASPEPLQRDVEIENHGMGAFACLRDKWPGFNSRMRGYGGEEGIIHRKFKHRGDKAISLAGFNWLHRFMRSGQVPYENTWQDRIRNLQIGFAEVGVLGEDLPGFYTRLLKPSRVMPILMSGVEEIAHPLFLFDQIYILQPPDSEPGYLLEQLAPALRRARPIMVSPRSCPSVPTGDRGRAHHFLCQMATAANLHSVLIIDDPLNMSEDLIQRLGEALREQAMPRTRTQTWFVGAVRLSGQFSSFDESRFLVHADGISASAAGAYLGLGSPTTQPVSPAELALPQVADTRQNRLGGPAESPAIRAFMITYQGDEQRVRNYQEMNRRLSGLVEMVPAVDAINQDFDELCKAGIREGIFTRAYQEELLHNISGEVPRTPGGKIPVGKVGCKMSHFRLLRKLVDRFPETQWFLIMEDDCVLDDDGDDVLTNLVAIARQAEKLGAGYVRLCVYPEFEQQQFESALALGQGLYTAVPQWGTCAYLISRQATRWVLRDLPTDLNTDNYFSSCLDQLKAVAVRSPFTTAGEYLPPGAERSQAAQGDISLASLIWQN